MKLKYLNRLLLVLMPVLLVLTFLWTKGTAPPRVPFARVTRGTVTSTLNTNGKVEPVQWSAVRAGQPGAVESVFVVEGQNVKPGQLLVQQDASAARLELSSAEARIAEARAQAAVLAEGGQAGELAEIENGLARARADLAAAQREVDTLERLVKRNAATRSELLAAKTLVQNAELEIRALERRRASLVTSTDREIAEARISEAQSVA
ncbi:MAG: biotin/lipoyl-binding protein, partial [Bryobacteraceae bacterium]